MIPSSNLRVAFNSNRICPSLVWDRLGWVKVWFPNS